MATFVSNVQVDGVTPLTFNGFPDTYQWSNRFLRGVDLFAGNPGDNYAVNMNQSGSWTIRDMTFVGSSPKTITMTDLDSQPRSYELLQFFDNATVNIDFTTTRANVIRGFGGRYDFSLGGRFYDYIGFGSDHDFILNLPRGGELALLRSYGPDSDAVRTVTTAGDIEVARLRNAFNDVTVEAGGFITYLRLNNAELVGQRNTVLVEGRIEDVFVSNAGSEIRVADGGRINNIRIGSGTHFVETSDEQVSSVSAFNATTTMRIGSGGVGQLTVGGAGGRQNIEIDGFAGIINVTSENRLVLTLGEGGAGMVRATATGNNFIRTGEGFVEAIQTGAANDIIVIGSGGVGFAHGGSGDDRFVFTEIREDRIARVNGGFGNDTADFRRLGFGVDVDLGETGLQAVGERTGGSMAPIVLQSIENLIGTGFDDVLIGSQSGNVLQGLDGDDVLIAVGGDNFLFGGQGDDRLVAGTGNDRMRGGPGTNTFVFGADNGFNTIRDYQRVRDRIEIVGEDGPASFEDLTLTQVTFGTRVDYGDTRILLENIFRTDLITEANFDFV